jgi:hypothetical protein
MLATLAALQLLAAAPLAAPPEPADGSPPAQEGAAPAAEAAPEAIPAPAPPPAAEPGEAAAGKAPPRDEASRARAADAAPGRPRQQSLLSGESLRGGSAVLAWLGWSSLGAAYAIGFSDRDDGGLFLDHDWAKSETRIGILYRRALSPVGSFATAARLAVAWYENFGATWVYGENHSDRGFEVSPGLSLSRAVPGGLFSTVVEAPLTVTTKYENGVLFTPRASLAFEAPLYPSVTIGARAGVGYRAGAGGAPLREGRGELQFLVLLGYQLL